MKEKNKGITLIVLIITIIIMLILLGVSSKILIDGKIIGSAEKAVNATNNKIDAEQTRVDYLTGELDIAIQNQCDHQWGDWVIIQEATETENGTRKKQCTKCGKTITQSIVYLRIGAYIEGYNPTIGKNGETITAEYTSEGASTGGTQEIDGTLDGTKGNGSSNQTFKLTSITNWRILGKDNEGRILITTADPITTTSNTGFKLKGQAGYKNGEKEFETICKMYGNGKFADKELEARSMKLEDIITKNIHTDTGTYWMQQNPDTPENSTYYVYVKDTNLYPKGYRTGWTKFSYFDEDNTPAIWKTLEPEDGEKTFNMKGTNAGTDVLMGTELANNMILKMSDGETNSAYWLNTKSKMYNGARITFTYWIVRNGKLYPDKYLYLNGAEITGNAREYAIRPVVTLDIEVQLSYNDTTCKYEIIE